MRAQQVAQLHGVKIDDTSAFDKLLSKANEMNSNLNMQLQIHR